MAKIHYGNENGIDNDVLLKKGKNRAKTENGKKKKKKKDRGEEEATTYLSSKIGGGGDGDNPLANRIANRRRKDSKQESIVLIVTGVVLLFCFVTAAVVIKFVIFTPNGKDDVQPIMSAPVFPGISVDTNFVVPIDENLNETDTEDDIYQDDAILNGTDAYDEEDNGATSMVVIEVTERKLTRFEITGRDEIVDVLLAKTRAKDDLGEEAEEVSAFHGNQRHRRLGDEIVVVDWESDCQPCEYYKWIKDWDIAELRTRLELNVRNLDYSDSDDPLGDTWKALVDVHRVAHNNSSNPNSADEVRLIYINKNISSFKNQSGTNERIDRWNREHVWPKGRGVGKNDNDPKHNDIHHLFPSDVNTNEQARGNRYFDYCSDTKDCKVWKMAVNDGTTTEYKEIRYEATNTGKFQPPEETRGVVARAIFYMDLRYPELELTDNPDPSNTNQMGNLTTLLQWHDKYPPEAEELQRNNRVCSKWQGNRNPFVDFPVLATIIYGNATIRGVGNTNLFQNCGNNESEIPDTNDTPSTPEPSPGDVMIVGVHSEGNADLVALVALKDLPTGWVVRITDNAYDESGKSFQTNEGTLSLTLSNAIPAGTVFGYGQGLLNGDAWEAAEMNDKNFDLSVSGDTVTVCATTETNPNVCTLLSAISVAGGTKFRDLPESIAAFSVELGNQDNYVYTGETAATKEALQTYLVDKNEWKGSDEKTGLPGFKNEFEIIEPIIADPMEVPPSFADPPTSIDPQ